MPAPTVPGVLPVRYLTQDEVRRLFAVIDSPRDRLLFALIYQHGLRVGEVALLQCGDANLERGRMLVRRLKGGRWSEQPLFGATAHLLREHLARISADTARPLFPGRHGPLRKRRIQSLFCQYRDAAGIDRRYSCHSLRHAIATHLLDSGQSLRFIQDHLGHVDPRSTAWYARVTDHHRAEIFRQLEASPWVVQVTPDSSSLLASAA